MDEAEPPNAFEPANDRESPEDTPWKQRPLLLAALGLVTGIAVHLILGDSRAPDGSYRVFSPSAETLALAAALVTAAGLFGFTVERRRWLASLVFALAGGAVAGLVLWWNGAPGGWSAHEGWRVVSLFLALAIAAPLFQAARDAGRPRFAYAAVHDHAWTNVVLWCACWVFVGLVFAMAYLLASLFRLIDLRFLFELLEKEWFARGLIGLGFGAALGLLREHDGVVRLLQRVVATVLAVLAPVLAVGLLLFLGALPFTGLKALWDATDSTTPILLSCLIGALILANAVIGNSPEQESRFPLLRFGAIGLAVAALPLAVLAAIATGLRVGQYGYTPERLWAVTFVGLALLYGLGYWWSLIRGRLDWERVVRPVNLGLAFAVCLVALLLATPLISFNAISTRDQLARLESGRVGADKFDWQALAFDFGKPGRDALKKLQGSANAAIKARADEAASAESRWSVPQNEPPVDIEQAAKAIRVLPQPRPLPSYLVETLARSHDCGKPDKGCTVFFLPGDSRLLLFRDLCYSDQAEPWRYSCPTEFTLVAGRWSEGETVMALSDSDRAALAAGLKAGRIEVRPIARRQLFVGGVPVGEPFE